MLVQTSNEDTLLRPQHFAAGDSQFCVRQYEASDHNDVLLLQVRAATAGPAAMAAAKAADRQVSE